MMTLRWMAWLCIFILFSCHTGKMLTGSYQADHEKGAQLVLSADSTFQWIYPGNRAFKVGTNTPVNLFYYMGGKWSVDRQGLWLNVSSLYEKKEQHPINDSITRFTSISAFSFWNRFGEQVNIRSIRLPRARAKPHFGNTLYFFSQDFSKEDTLVFYLDGYRPFEYPGSISRAIGDNIHKITLYEPVQETTEEMLLKIKGSRLYAPEEWYTKVK